MWSAEQQRRRLLLTANNFGEMALSPIFSAILQSTLVPEVAAGSSTPTFTRATTAVQTDFEGKLNSVLSGEARMQGARRVSNLCPTSSASISVAGNKTITVGVGTFVFSMGAEATGTSLITFTGTATGSTGTLTANATSRTSKTLTITVGGTIIATCTTAAANNIQFENVTGQSNQNPSEYVSVGVLSAPYHGAGVDGVKYFTTLNGNTVASNVVTEATGAAISSSACKFGVLPGVSGAYFSTPDAAANQITSDIDLRVKAALTDWTSSLGTQGFVAKRTTANDTTCSYGFSSLVTTGVLVFAHTNGSTVTGVSSTAAPAFAAGTTHWVRVTWKQSTGATNFYTSEDGVTWTQLGSANVAGPTTALNAASLPFTVGSLSNGTAFNTAGRIYRAQVYNGINGTLAVDFNPNLSTSAQTFTAATGEVWTTNGTARIFGNTNTTYGIPAPRDSGGNTGYLAEGARTNLCLQSQTFDNATWVKSAGTTVTADQYVASDGTTTMDKLTEGAGGAFTNFAYQSIAAVTANANYAVQMEFKYVDTPWILLDVFSGANEARCWYNIQTAVKGTESLLGTATVVSNTITPLANGNRLVKLVVNLASGTTTASVYTANATADASTTTIAGTRGQWGAQLEDNVSSCSSYIPTTTVAVTRNADVLTYVAAGNISGVKGTTYLEYIPNAIFNYAYLLSGASGTVTYTLLADSAGRNQSYDLTNNPVTVGVYTAGSLTKVGLAYGGSAMQIAYNGTAPAATAFDGDFNFPANFAVGCGNGGAGNIAFGTIRKTRIYGRALTAAQLQAMTS